MDAIHDHDVRFHLGLDVCVQLFQEHIQQGRGRKLAARLTAVFVSVLLTELMLAGHVCVHICECFWRQTHIWAEFV